MNRLRILLLAPESNPDGVSIPFVTYSHAAALAKQHDVAIVVASESEDRVRRAGAPFRSIEVIRMPKLQRIHDWCFRRIFKSNFDSQAVTAFGYPFALAFEWYAWRQLRHRIAEGEFDVVLRLVPMTPSVASPFAYLLRKGPIPFVLGPLNGGLPWPAGFRQLENQKQWISNFRNFYRYLPFARSTYREARAIIAASSQTFSEFAGYGQKVFFVPEPGISSSQCLEDLRAPVAGAKLELIFVGGLVPRKACDIALRAAAPILLEGKAHLTVIGDGPERGQLERLAASLGIADAVTFSGWIDHSGVLLKLRTADVFLFPSVRDNGAGVVFEALANGAVPVVADFGGPGDIVNSEVGYKVPLTNEDEVVAQMQKIVTALSQDRELLYRLRKQGMTYARESLTWDAKAMSTTQVLNWAVGRAPRPNLPPPKVLCSN